MSSSLSSTTLPKRFTNWFITAVNETSTVRLVVVGVIIYCAVAMLFSVAFSLVSFLYHPLVYKDTLLSETVTAPEKPVTHFPEILYFNFITILTVGYGDLHPVGIGRFLAALEALIGVGLFGSVIGVVIIKLTHPAKDSIVFSKYAYFSLEVNRFFVIFVNTHRDRFINVQLSSILKISRNNNVEPPSMAPYIGHSVWVFFLHRLTADAIRRHTFYADDGLKFGLTGTYGFARYSTAIKYTFDQILVVQNSNILVHNPIVLNPKFGDPRFEELFHFKPQGAYTFKDYAARL